MEDKIEIGEYVRLDRNQGINKIVDMTQDGLYELDEIIGDEWGSETYIIGNEDIVKHSKNIIDLIEVGDYVNGKYVYSVGTVIGNLPIVNHTVGTFTPSSMIKSIVTHEQFESVKYEV